jgi:transposase InsO family protein
VIDAAKPIHHPGLWFDGVRIETTDFRREERVRRSRKLENSIKPKDPAEAIAVFRTQVLGPVLCKSPESHGELVAALRELSATPVKSPGQCNQRCYSIPTLQRWYYAYRRDGIAGLRPRHVQRGLALQLTDEQRKLLLTIREEHPAVSTALIVRTLEHDGRLPKDAVSIPTVRRLYRRHGLNRRYALNKQGRERKRWHASAPGVLWHTDVCHGPALRVNGAAQPLRIHALMDDHSRYVVAIAACATERETEMIYLVAKALMRHGAPDGIYTDNGPTYIGETLSTVCARLGIGLLHAKPYDPQARGKMERFWRTLREQCLNHMGEMTSLISVQERINAWLQGHYHTTPHSSLMGKSPAAVFEAAPRQPYDHALLAEAMVVRADRKIRSDGTLSIAGIDFECEQSYLAGHKATVGRSLLEPGQPPWIEYEDQRYFLHPVDLVKNGDGKRAMRRKSKTGIDSVPFEPLGPLLEMAEKRERELSCFEQDGASAEKSR